MSTSPTPGSSSQHKRRSKSRTRTMTLRCQALGCPLAISPQLSTARTPVNTSTTPSTHTHQYTPRKRRQYSDDTLPTPRCTPCPRIFNHTSLLPPNIPPFVTTQGLEAERVDLLTALQHKDHESTTVLGAICSIQGQLDFPNPLPPYHVKELRRSLRVQRNRADVCMRKERHILQRLGEIAFQLQQIARWERVTVWHAGLGMGMRPDGLAPVGMSPEAAFENRVFRPLVRQWEQQAYGTQVYGQEGDNTHASSVGATSSSLGGMSEQSSGYGAHPLNPNCSPYSSCTTNPPSSYYDNTSGVTSAATTRRNTMMFPPNTPLNSRHGSITAHGHGISRLDLGNGMAMLEQSNSDGCLLAKVSGRDAAYRRSEPGLLVGHWNNGAVQQAEYLEKNAPASSPPVKIRDESLAQK